VKHPDFVLGIPLCSDDSKIHDYVVQAKGAFDQTMMGYHQLASHGLRIEVPVVRCRGTSNFDSTFTLCLSLA